MKKCYLRVNKQRNILHIIRKRKANWIGYILRRKCFLKQVTEGKIQGQIEVARRHKKLLDDLGDKRGYSHLKEEALDHTKWRICFGKSLAVIWHITDDDGIRNIYKRFNAGQLSLTSNITGACTMKWVHLYTAHFHSKQSRIKPTHIWIYNIPIHSFSGMYKALITLHRCLKFFFFWRNSQCKPCPPHSGGF